MGSNQRPVRRPAGRPEGPRRLPHEVYVRRRIAVAVAALLLLALLFWMVKAIAGGGAAEETQTTTASSTVGSSTVDMTSQAEPPNQKTEAASTEPEADPNVKQVCTIPDLVVTATPGAPSFAAGQMPNFFINIKNPTAGDCLVDFDANELKFEVFTLSNYQRVWADLDCNSPEVRGKVTIVAGDEVTYELGAWSRTTSAPDSCENRQPVEAGSYLLYGHVGDNVSEPATFNLNA